ncbi:ABC transporter type 1, transmembrane domain-containing protein [Syncephalis fuscata]|nr:ABC transporter type 1, transmembrane domain-containing protein [Syncephalis fuscata]
MEEMTVPPSQRPPIDGLDVSVSPLIKAGFFSRLTFQWMNPFVMLGRRVRITEDHLPELCPDDDCRLLSDTMKMHWDTELELVKQNKKKSPNLWRVLFKTLGHTVITSGLICCAESIVKISEAIFLGQIINFFQRPEAKDQEGYLWAMALTLAVSLHIILHHQFFFPAMRIGFQTRSGLIALLYRKVLALPASAATSTGEVVNLVSNDVQCFETASAHAHFIWAAPLELILIMVALYLRIGWAAFVGMGVLIMLVPLHSLFARRYSRIRHKTSNYRDDRIRTVGDLLSGIELVKLSAWEDPLEKTVNEKRDRELNSLMSAAWMKAFSESIHFVISGLVSLCTFTAYYAAGNALTPDKVFTSLALFNVMRTTMGVFFPMAIEKWAECTVSVRRIVAFLQLPEVSDLLINETETAPADTDDTPNSQAIISFGQANFTWATRSAAAMNALLKTDKKKKDTDTLAITDTKAPPVNALIEEETIAVSKMPSIKKSVSTDDTLPEQLVLEDITLDLMKDELLVVVGPVGSGKSSLCMAVLRELLPISGQMSVHLKPRHADGKMRIAYLAQHPWILSGTVRDNILFGEQYDATWYRQVVEGCALEKDFELLSSGDNTYIGERGVTLRAVYMRADLYVLDDPLSAVDPHVARHLFENALRKLLSDRPRLLVTHQLQFTRHCDRVLVLDEGRIVALGNPYEVLEQEIDSTDSKSQFLSELREYARQSDSSDDASSVNDNNELLAVPSALTATSNNKQRSNTLNSMAGSCRSQTMDFQPIITRLHKSSTARSQATILSTRSDLSYIDRSLDDMDILPEIDESGAPTSNNNRPMEDQAEGNTPLSTYWQFFRFGASAPVIVLAACALSGGQAVMVAADWFLARWANTPVSQQTDWHISYIYIGLVIGACIIAVIRTTVSFWLLLNASRWMFRAMLHSILTTSMQFFHVNPHGRILNRFSKDQSNVDELLPMTLFDAIQCLFLILGALVVISIVNPFIMIAIPFILASFMVLRWLYMNASRQVKRIESVTRSPVYSLLSETLYGLVTVRAYNAQDRFWKQFSEAQNANARAFFAFLGCARWVGFRLDVCSGFLLALMAFVSIIMRSSQQASLVGLSLSYVLQLVDCLQWAVRQTIEVEMQFISVERIMAYTKLDPEPPRHTDTRPPENWPESGLIEFKDMSLAYPGTDEAVLKNITLSIEGGEKIGVVGRTGAGKSSLLTALFRLSEATPTGCIVIDGLPISELGVHDLRSRLSIIPQTPVMFKGSLRFNLDPFDQYTDSDLWQALDAVELNDALNYYHGKNFSAGERQLISLCRAILRNARVVVMDEATANMDLGTDRRIQRAILVGAMSADIESSNSSIQTLNEQQEEEEQPLLALTAQMPRGSDRVLVLDAGSVQEFGPPNKLLLIKSGANTPDGQGWLRRMVLQTGEAGERAIRRVEEQTTTTTTTTEQ